jgi:hypothetical protein
MKAGWLVKHKEAYTAWYSGRIPATIAWTPAQRWKQTVRWRLSVKVGDLVKLRTASGHGFIVAKDTSMATPVVYRVLTKGSVFPFLPSQLEVISESR